eukprot:TRINITY_DN10940_c0_g1_i1.p1 TRINITY_DN10940_c0_g1~~TRINITY_DN10940_c0_g1_i1.p1  ORF type:complete len:151 (+),score=24.51 TRINITY_DN10940_c0_g1_i1:9-461(+)
MKNRNDWEDLQIEEEEIQVNEGHWTREEHKKYDEAMQKYGHLPRTAGKWKLISQAVDTRTPKQCEGHFQKFKATHKNFKEKVVNINECKKFKNSNSPIFAKRNLEKVFLLILFKVYWIIYFMWLLKKQGGILKKMNKMKEEELHSLINCK